MTADVPPAELMGQALMVVLSITGLKVKQKKIAKIEVLDLPNVRW